MQQSASLHKTNLSERWYSSFKDCCFAVLNTLTVLLLTNQQNLDESCLESFVKVVEDLLSLVRDSRAFSMYTQKLEDFSDYPDKLQEIFF